MEIKVAGLENVFHSEIVKFDKNNNLILKIDDNDIRAEIN